MKRSLAGLTAVFALVIAGIAAGTPGASAATLPQAVPGGPYSALLGNAIQFDGTASDAERNCWMAVHQHIHGVPPSEYDIREIDEDLYLAVLARRKAEDG